MNWVVLLCIFFCSGGSAVAYVKNQMGSSREPVDYLEAVNMLKSTSLDELEDFNYYRLRFLFFISHTMTDGEVEIGIDIKESLDQAIEENDFQGIIAAAEKILEKDFTDMRAHVWKAMAHMKLGEKEKELYDRSVTSGLFHSILRSGDGKSIQTAWHIFQLKEASDVLKQLGFFMWIKQSLLENQGRSYTLIEAKNSQGETAEFYFDITELSDKTPGIKQIVLGKAFKITTGRTGDFLIGKGIGLQYRDIVEKANQLIGAGQFSEAEALVDEVIAFFHSLMVDNDKVYVSVGLKSELEEFKKDSSNGKEVVWLDICFDQALHLKAFIKSEQKQLSEALHILDEEVKVAPYSAFPYIERGVILNSQREHQMALQSYEMALKLARKYESSRGSEAMALRGMGFTLIELGDLDRAEAILKESILIDPGNASAKRELRYIRGLRSSGH
jgi:tetratricopeptide (TPR) repeat protein